MAAPEFNAVEFESLGVYQGEYLGLRRTKISPQGLGYLACQAYGVFLVSIEEALCAAASHIKDSNRCSGFTKDGFSPLSIRYFDRFMSFFR
jgi:hypothetical protein